MTLHWAVYTLHDEEILLLRCASAIAGAWACVYLYLGVLDERYEFSTLSDGDDLGADEEGDSDLCVVSRWLDGARLGFWAHVALQARLLWVQRAAWSDAELQWLTAQRVGALFALTRTFRGGARRPRAFHALGAVVYFSSLTSMPWPLTPVLLVLDALLVMGHLYDCTTPIRTVLNTRLFYLACASSASLVYLCCYDDADGATTARRSLSSSSSSSSSYGRT
jgi:hypothetical protein